MRIIVGCIIEPDRRPGTFVEFRRHRPKHRPKMEESELDDEADERGAQFVGGDRFDFKRARRRVSRS